jgi:hypothetical protein
MGGGSGDIWLCRNRSRLLKAKGTARTHNLQYLKPDFVVDEVSWMLEGFQVSI